MKKDFQPLSSSSDHGIGDVGHSINNPITSFDGYHATTDASSSHPLEDGTCRSTSEARQDENLSEESISISLANWLGFFFAGLLNNTSYVIMLAGAKHIDPSLVSVVYICNVLPSMLIKLTGPYWFHYIPYKVRVAVQSLLMTLSFLMVAFGNAHFVSWVQLVGIAVGSAGGGLGEASFLALTTFFAGRSSVTAWSSGTGMAGPVGYLWVIMFTIVFKVDFSTSLLYGLVMPVAFWLNYTYMLGSPVISREEVSESDCEKDVGIDTIDSSDPSPDLSNNGLLSVNISQGYRSEETSDLSYTLSPAPDGKEGSKDIDTDPTHAITSMTLRARFVRTLDLWPFTVPLFTVYLAEYAMQSGPWAAIGFPVTSKSARDQFYEYSNFAYQGGVLLSRSSGLIFKANMAALWIMPALQVVLLLFFVLVAYTQFWYDYSLMIMCFAAGLLGGAVYVGGFALMRETVAPELKEFSLSAASLFDTLGIVVATFVGAAIQHALYRHYDLDD
jgi:battenin